jgi:aldose 1-epimerase
MKQLNYFTLAISVAILVSCGINTSTKKWNITACDTAIKREDFQKEIDGKKVDLYTITNHNGMVVKITNYGARVVSILTPDKQGNFTDVVLGYPKLEQYLKDKFYFGGIIGRYANRIAKGKFKLDGKEYSLPINSGINCLHGGLKGFDNRVWDASADSNSVTLSYTSKDMEEGFPGEMKVKAKYTLTPDNELKLEIEATADKKTVVNLTSHSYFNLKGEGNGDIMGHLLQINADYVTVVDTNSIPTGELIPVSGTPFDLRKEIQINQELVKNHPQLDIGKGFDHNWVLNKKELNELSFAVKLIDPESGRVMELYTSEPGVQCYSGNYLDVSAIGICGKPYTFRSGIAFEPQHFPDSPNHPNFPTTVLEPGQTYKHISIYKFYVQ